MDEQKTKENFETITDKKCICSSVDGLFVPNRQLSLVVSVCIALLFFSFSAGYFLGGQQTTEEFLQQVEYTSLNDEMDA